MKKRTQWIGILMAALMLIVAACGSGNNNAGNAGSNANAPAIANNEAAANNGAADNSTAGNGGETAAAGPIVIKTAKGDVTLEKPADRVVTLEWTYTEDLLAVGVQPIGHADLKGYNAWVNIPVELSAEVTDVGTRQEPNIETIMSLQPDLIIAAANRVANNYDQLAAIAPVLVFNGYPEEGGVDQYTEMEQTFAEIAKAVGKEGEVEGVLAKLDSAYAAAAEKLKTAGKEGAEIVLTQAWSANNVPEFRLFTDNSMAIQILNRIGLKNAHKSDKFEVYGFSTTSVEGFTTAQHASVLHMVQDNDNVFENQLKDNAVWKELTFVKENRIYGLGGDTWPFGGPLGAEVFANKAADLLAK
jgi:ferric hydroxamate transport system substrate-binding protein